MGKNPRRKQDLIGTKLRQIRDALELSQAQIAQRLQLPENFTRSIISNYENDEREPPFFVLLAYAREAGVCLDVIVDDDVELPKDLPATPVHRPVAITRSKSRKAKARGKK
jgi:transcriptional regulator with XRE-family HTH domain